MAKLSFPADTEQRFRALATLSDEHYRRLVSITSQLDSAQIAGGLDEALNAQWSEAPQAVHDALWAASILHIGPVEAGEGLPEFIDDLTETLFASPTFRIKDLTETAFREKLQPFVDMESFALALRAGNVRYDNERNFVQARTLTDIRPVFAPFESTNEGTAETEGASARPGRLEIKKAVIVHYLKITYTQFGSHADFFVALDDDDVDALIATLDRARRKAESIDAFLSTRQRQYRTEDSNSD